MLGVVILPAASAAQETPEKPNILRDMVLHDPEVEKAGLVRARRPTGEDVKQEKNYAYDLRHWTTQLVPLVSPESGNAWASDVAVRRARWA